MLAESEVLWEGAPVTRLPTVSKVIDAEFVVVRGPRPRFDPAPSWDFKADDRRRRRAGLVLLALVLGFAALDSGLGVTSWIRAHWVVPAVGSGPS